MFLVMKNSGIREEYVKFIYDQLPIVYDNITPLSNIFYYPTLRPKPP